jgi:hypothetical protein
VNTCEAAWTAWAAIGTLAGAAATFVTAGLLWRQISSANHVAGINLVLEMESRFLSTTMREKRALAVRLIGNPAAQTEEFSAIDDVLDLFDTVGYLTRKRDLDAVMVWHRLAMGCYIDRLRRGDPTLWEDFLWLDDRLCEIQTRRAAADSLPWSDEAVRDFKDMESSQEPNQL